MTYSLITLLIITEYSDSARVWKVDGVWYTTQRAELTERMKRLRATNTQPDNSTLKRMEGQELTRLRQLLREMTRQKDAVIQRHEGTITQQQRVITGYRDNPSWLIEGDVTGEESKEAMLIQLNQSRELAEGVTVILV